MLLALVISGIHAPYIGGQCKENPYTGQREEWLSVEGRMALKLEVIAENAQNFLVSVKNALQLVVSERKMSLKLVAIAKDVSTFILSGRMNAPYMGIIQVFQKDCCSQWLLD